MKSAVRIKSKVKSGGIYHNHLTVKSKVRAGTDVTYRLYGPGATHWGS